MIKSLLFLLKIKSSPTAVGKCKWRESQLDPILEAVTLN